MAFWSSRSCHTAPNIQTSLWSQPSESTPVSVRYTAVMKERGAIRASRCATWIQQGVLENGGIACSFSLAALIAAPVLLSTRLGRLRSHGRCRSRRSPRIVEEGLGLDVHEIHGHGCASGSNDEIGKAKAISRTMVQMAWRNLRLHPARVRRGGSTSTWRYAGKPLAP